MITQESQIVIRRPVEEVFTYLANPENNPQWEKAVVESKLITSGPLRVGSEFSERVKLIGSPIQVVCTILEYDFPRVIAYRSDTSSRVKYEGRIQFESAGRDTRLTFTGKNQLGGFYRILEPLMRGEMEKELGDDLKKLKSVLEERVPV